jgi:hypothetical protein
MSKGKGDRIVRVRWDGNKTIYTYHKDFIEIIPEQVCAIDLSDAPVLRELLGIVVTD